jgi:hypothetical protein
MVGAEVAPHWPQLLQFGQTHSTVHLRSGTCFVTGWITSRDTSRTLQCPQQQPSWQPLLQEPQPHWPQLSQPAHLLQQQGVTPGMQTSSHLQLYSCLVTALGAQ